MTQWMQQLLWHSFAMSVITGVYYIATVLLRKRYAAKWFYLAGMILLIGFLIPSRPAFTIEMEKAPVFLQSSANQEASAQTPVAYEGVRENMSETQAAAQISLWTIAFIGWAVGACGTMLYHGIRHVRFTRAAKRWSVQVKDAELLAQFEGAKRDLLGEGCKTQLMHCACIPGPMLLWLGKPTVLLPKHTMAANDSHFILRHELIHYKRKDILCRYVMLLATALNWFNPAIYFLSKLVTLQCEISCDEKVVENQDIGGRHQYAMSIIGVARYQSKGYSLLTTSFYGGKFTMKKRITSIFEPTKKKIGSLLLSCTILMTLAAGTSIAVEKQSEGYTYLAVAEYSPPEGIEDTSRMIRVRPVDLRVALADSAIVTLLLPEGSGTAEDNSAVGIRVTFDEPIEAWQEQNGTKTAEIPYDIFEPTHVEIIGPLQRGIIAEIGEDYVLLNTLETGDPSRYTITPDTIMWYVNPFKAGSGCVMIVDEEGVALAIVESNG